MVEIPADCIRVIRINMRVTRVPAEANDIVITPPDGIECVAHAEDGVLIVEAKRSLDFHEILIGMEDPRPTRVIEIQVPRGRYIPIEYS